MTYHQERLVTYNNQLHPWSIIRIFSERHEAKLSQRESRVIIRFRHRNDAEAHLQILRANNPTACYELIFDVTPKQSDLTVKSELSQSACIGSNS
jgi:hypothetical protein